MRSCWCGNADLIPFGPDYGQCPSCESLVYLKELSPDHTTVKNDEVDFYGRQYWLEHQSKAFGYDDIQTRARNDLSERNLYWLNTLLKYKLPPAKVLEVGCSHGSFVSLLRQAGYDASGIELSPWVVEFGRKTFDIPISVGPVEELEIPFGSIDVIVLMDVLEHFPSPIATMTHYLKLLKPEGLLLLQTPEFKAGMKYSSLVETKGDFLEQLKLDEHLYLFSANSIRQFFEQINADHIRFEPAIFGHYDMFMAVSRVPLVANTIEEIDASLSTPPHGPMVQALLDIYNRESSEIAVLEADKQHLVSQLKSSEADRAARLEVIEVQGQKLERIARLEAEKDHLVAQLDASEADRVARLEVIEAQGRKLERIRQLEADNKDLLSKLTSSEADRTARLEVIEAQGRELERMSQLEADKADLATKLKVSDADRAAQLEVIEAQNKKLERVIQLEADKEALSSKLEFRESEFARLCSHWLIKILLKTGLLSINR